MPTSPKKTKKAQKCSHPRAFIEPIYGSKPAAYRCSLCEATGVDAPTAPPYLYPGVYRLTADVDNSHGRDGRSNDWTKQAVIEAGQTFFVFDHPRGCYIERRENNGYCRIEPTHPSYDDMVAKLDADSPSHGEWLSYQHRSPGNYIDAFEVLEEMLNTGKLTRADVFDTIEAIKAKEEPNV